MTEYVTSKDGTRIAFDRLGKGPAVILVGGAFQHRAVDPKTKQLASLVGERFTVFHYDRRGRGESGDSLPYSVEREIEDLEALITEAGGSGYLFGNSSGGALSLRAASKLPKIKKLALYEVPFNSGDEGALEGSKYYSKELGRMLVEGRREDAVEFTLTTWGIPFEAIAGMRQTPLWSGFESVAHTLAYDNAIMGNGSVPGQLLKSISAPVLVISGGSSPRFMHEAADAVAKGLPKALRRTLQGQTHDVDPKVLAPMLMDFFSW